MSCLFICLVFKTWEFEYDFYSQQKISTKSLWAFSCLSYAFLTWHLVISISCEACILMSRSCKYMQLFGLTTYEWLNA